MVKKRLGDGGGKLKLLDKLKAAETRASFLN
jgi:hypothetical protein